MAFLWVAVSRDAAGITLLKQLIEFSDLPAQNVHYCVAALTLRHSKIIFLLAVLGWLCCSFLESSRRRRVTVHTGQHRAG